MAIYNSQNKPNPQIQVGVMQKCFPAFKHSRKGNNVVFKGDLFIAPEITIYTISIECGVEIRPKVKVINPKLKDNAPHTYPDRSLCLYHSSNFQWDSKKLITNEIIHWTVAWIYFYEYWLQTGEWIAEEFPHSSKKKEE
ncbi:hypothetical protein FACS1894201_11100 [Bacteroidia bacterium]|nr:hypothetical protein FACS1894201_11100 [Bacteroidia bacterium]